jgi:hypothetical protein
MWDRRAVAAGRGEGKGWQPMNQYPPSQDPWGQPADPQPQPQHYPPQQEPQYAPPQQSYDPQPYPHGGYDPNHYPQQVGYAQPQYAPAAQPYDPYGQQAQYAPPQYAPPQQGYGPSYAAPGYPGYGYGAQPAQPANPQQRRLFTIGAVVAAVLAVLVVLHPFGGAGFGGTWVGPETQQVQGATVPVAELLMDLTQSGTTITGTGQQCFNTSNGAVSENFSVSGTANGTNARLTLTFPSDNSPASAALSGGTLTLTAPSQSGATTVTMQQGTLTAFSQACARLVKIDQTGG